MSVLLPFWIVPGLFVLGCLVLVLLRPKGFWARAGTYALLAYAASLALGTGGILESRGSTSGLGFIFLPLFALIPGVLGFLLGFAHFRFLERRRASCSATIARVVVVVAALGVAGAMGYQIVGWIEVKQTNQARDLEAQRQRAAIKDNTAEIKKRLAAHPGEEARLIAELAAQTQDRTLLIPLASNRFASPSVLDDLVRSADFGVALSAVRNENVSPQSLAWVYRNHSYPAYFYSSLAANPRTPGWILAELYAKRRENMGIAPGLAGNPNTPSDLIDGLVGEADWRTLRAAAKNPSLSCAQIDRLREDVQNKPVLSSRKRLLETLEQRLASCSSGDL